jgi:chitosanase
MPIPKRLSVAAGLVLALALAAIAIAVAVLTPVTAAESPRGPSNSPTSAVQAAPDPQQPAADPSDQSLNNPVLRARANSILATFEYSTTDYESTYGEAHYNNDGRGITAGPVGFTTGTSDALVVVKGYSEVRPDNPLARYIEALEAIDEVTQATGIPNDSIVGLEGFEAAWRQAAEDPLFRQVQDQNIQDVYFEPALEKAQAIGITTALGQFIFFDAEVQHGGGTDDDGTPAMIQDTITNTGLSSVSNLTDEAKVDWLQEFLKVRVEHLQGAKFAATQDGWAESVPRAYAQAKFLNEDKLQLQLPLEWESYGHEPFSLR